MTSTQRCGTFALPISFHIFQELICADLQEPKDSVDGCRAADCHGRVLWPSCNDAWQVSRESAFKAVLLGFVVTPPPDRVQADQNATHLRQMAAVHAPLRKPFGNWWLLAPAFVTGLLGGGVYVGAFSLIAQAGPWWDMRHILGITDVPVAWS